MDLNRDNDINERSKNNMSETKQDSRNKNKEGVKNDLFSFRPIESIKKIRRSDEDELKRDITSPNNNKEI